MLRLENLEKSVVMFMYGGSECQNYVPVKLDDFLPNKVLIEGRLSWDVEDEQVLLWEEGGVKSQGTSTGTCTEPCVVVFSN